MRRPTFGGKGRKACYNLTLVTSSHLQKRERERERERDCWDATQNFFIWFCMISPHWQQQVSQIRSALIVGEPTMGMSVSLFCWIHQFFVPTNKECQTKSVRTDNLLYIYIYIWYKPSQVCICCLQKLCSLVWVKPSPLLVGWLGWVWLDASDLNTNEQHITSHLPISMTCKFKLSLITNLPFSCICVFTTF